MRDKWRVDGISFDPCTNLVTGGNGISTVSVSNTETGDSRTVSVWSGTVDDMCSQAGEAISQGNFDK
jgi:hypothetical protein